MDGNLLLEKIKTKLSTYREDELVNELNVLIDKLYKTQKEDEKGYLDICHKIQIIITILYNKEKFIDEDYEEISKKIFEYIRSDEDRRYKLMKIIQENYIESKNKEFYLFKTEEEIDLNLLEVSKLDSEQFNRKHKKEIGFLSKLSIKQLFKKSACKLCAGTDKSTSEEQVDRGYAENGKFLTNFCNAYNLNIQKFFYKNKYFEKAVDYEDYIKPFLVEESNEENMHYEKRGTAGYINDEEINSALNISNEDMIEMIDNFLYEDRIAKYDLNVQNSKFIIELLQKAFLRGIDNQTIVDFIKDIRFTEQYEKYEDILLQHKAKILSNQKKDGDAIHVLEELLKIHEEYPEKYSLKSYTETLNLLGASYKRYCFETIVNINEVDGKNELLLKNLIKAKGTYKKAYDLPFNLNEKYYPALNISYLELIIGHLINRDTEKSLDMIETLWEGVEISITDYWSWISDIEKNILYQNYRKANEKIKNIDLIIDKNKVESFNIQSTIRQLKLYKEYCDTEDKVGIDEVIQNLENITTTK